MSACLPANAFILVRNLSFVYLCSSQNLWFFPFVHLYDFQFGTIFFFYFFSLCIRTASMEYTWNRLNKTLQTTYRIIDATCKLSYISKTSGKPFVSAPSTQDGCLYVWACDFLCETHSQLDAYFIIRFSKEGINAIVLSVSYSVHCLRLPSFAFRPRHIVCEFRLLSGFATTSASDSVNVMTAL